MDVEKYIASGILELYVAGALSDLEAQEITRLLAEHPELRLEVEKIEEAVVAYASAHTEQGAPAFHTIASKLSASEATGVRTLKKRNSWWAYGGWAAALLIGASAIYFYSENQQLQRSLEQSQFQQQQLENQIVTIREGLEEANATLRALGEKGIQVIPLAGQNIAPEAYARVYWDKEDQRVLIDASGLPEPPPGMVYQVWSLKLNPLTPTSIGLLDNYPEDTDKIFALANPNSSEAFGITLEPEGGSLQPTLEKLYALGAISG